MPDAAGEIAGFAIRVGGIAAWFADPEIAQEWASENYFGQWLLHPYGVPGGPEGASTESGGIEGFAVRKDAALVAWFLYAEEADDWAVENNFDPKAVHPFAIPNRRPFTPEHLEKARIEGAELFAYLVPGG